jgi:hypothetical protein
MGGQLRQVNPNYGQATSRQFTPNAPFPARPMYSGAMMQPTLDYAGMNPEIVSALQTAMGRATPYRINVPTQAAPQMPVGAARFLTGNLPYETNFGVPKVSYQVPQFQAGSYSDFMNRYDQAVADYLAEQAANAPTEATPTE